MSKRKMVEKEVGSFDSLRYCSLGDVLKQVQRCIELYGEDATLYETEYPYSDEKRLVIMQQVLETKEEMAKRVQLEAKQAKIKEERELAEFNRLAAKFGKK